MPSIPYDGMVKLGVDDMEPSLITCYAWQAPPQHDPLVGKDPTLDAIMDGVEDREPPASSDLQFQGSRMCDVPFVTVLLAPCSPDRSHECLFSCHLSTDFFADFKPEGAPMGDIESQPMMQPQTIGSMQPAAASQQDTDALIHGAGEDAAGRTISWLTSIVP